MTAAIIDSAPQHDHAECERILATQFKPARLCKCGHRPEEHERDRDGNPMLGEPCTECDTCPGLEVGGLPVCSIEEEMPHVAVHALPPGHVRGYFKLYCADCYVDIYGPHRCARLGCKPGCKYEGCSTNEEGGA